MNYWQKRQQELNKAMEKDEEKLKKRLSSYFDTEYRKLEKQIAAYYKQYGTDNVIQYRRLMESLPDEDKRLLIEQMDEFAKKYPQYTDLMPIRESIYKLNRLEGLQYSIRMQQLEIGAVENEQITEHLKRQAMWGANAAAETMGFGKNFYSEDSELIKKIVNTEWVNKDDFSELRVENGRLKGVWSNTAKLANYLNTDIAQGFARGDSYDLLTRRLRERFSSVSRNDAYRLIYTEGTYVMAEATMQPFTEDFEKYRLSTVGDGKVCSICRGVAGEVFNISDRQPGVNFPPLHPWCRCSFEIVVDDWDKWMDDYVAKHSRDSKQAEQISHRLGAKESEDLNKKTEKRYIGKVDYISALAVMTEFENQIRWARIENAVVIDKNGEVYQFIGQGDKVELFDIDFDAAYITHNHPESNGIISFGKDDFEFMKDHPEIKEFRCCNAQYDYSIRILKPMGDVVYNDIYKEALKQIDTFVDGNIDVQDEVMKILE